MKTSTLETYATRQVPRYTSYPTAAQFTPSVNAEQIAKWAADLPSKATLSLYLHVPFCRSMCWYCGCHTKATRKDGPLIAYGQTLERELETAAMAFAQGPEGAREVVSIHWGGGTPSLLPAESFHALVAAINANFSVSDHVEHAMEIDPRLADDALVQKLQRGGINRVSLGVQDFTPRVQAAIGRIQPFDMVADASRRLAAAGAGDQNFDLIYGLPLQSQADLLRSIDLSVSLSPARIALFGYAHVPWFKSHQKMIKEEMLPGAVERIEMAEAAAARLVTLGYRMIGIDHFAREDDTLAIAAAEGRLKRNFQGYTTDPADVVIGMGASSISSFPQGFAQNAPATPDWARAVDAGKFATVRGVATTREDRFRARLIEVLMCTLEVDVTRIAKESGVNEAVLGNWRERIDALVSDGLVSRNDSVVTVNEDARLFARVAAAIFDAYLQSSGRKHSVAV